MFTSSTLAKYPGLIKGTLELIETAFNYPENKSFDQDFFPIFNSSNFSNNHIIINNNKVIAHVGVKSRLMEVNDLDFPVVLLGGIAVDDKFRGKGLLKKLLESIFLLHREKASMFILWSNLDKLYEKFGFHQAGGQAEIGNSVFREKDLKKYKKTSFKKLSSRELDEIKYIYKNSTLRSFTTLSRDNNDWSEIQKITSTELYINRNPQGKIISYFCKNKGHDLIDIIHEFGHLESYRKQFLLELSNYKLWFPETKADKHKLTIRQLMYLASFKIGNANLFGDFIKEWSQKKITVSTIDPIKSIVKFNFKDEYYEQKIGNFLTNIWGPSPLEEFRDLGKPLYFSGLDSI